MKTLLSLTLLLLTVHWASGQKKDTPSNIAETITMLQGKCPSHMKAIIKKTNNDSLTDLLYEYHREFKDIIKWGENQKKSSKIVKYITDKGVSVSDHQMAIILIAFKQALLGQELNETAIIKPFKDIEEKWREEDKVRTTTDSIRGVYIPKDLDDCFKQIDRFWTDSTKVELKKLEEDNFTAYQHFGLGLWMRNNWGLWGETRLSKYFNDLEIFHPDDMSGIILTSYHRYLTGKDIKLEEQIKYYKDFWKKASEPK